MLSETPSIAITSAPAPQIAPALSLSIVIPTHGRLPALKKCLASILAAALPEETEILVVCNGSDPPTEAFLNQLASSDPRLRLIVIAPGSPAHARNLALSEARGEVVYFLDDDVTIAPDLFSRALEVFAERPEVDVLGGPNLTPAASSMFEQCVGNVLASPFGSAHVCGRYRSTGQLRATDDRALILCNLAIRRRAIVGRTPVFGSDLVCNEENLLLGLLALENRVMLHDPDLVVYHSRRATLGGFARQIFRYGRGRWQNTMALPGSLSPVYLIPSLFLLYLVAIPLLPAGWRLIPAAVYVVLLLVFAAKESTRTGRLQAFPQFLILFPACHLAYGAGLMWQCLLSLTGST